MTSDLQDDWLTLTEDAPAPASTPLRDRMPNELGHGDAGADVSGGGSGTDAPAPSPAARGAIAPFRAAPPPPSTTSTATAAVTGEGDPAATPDPSPTDGSSGGSDETVLTIAETDATAVEPNPAATEGTFTVTRTGDISTELVVNYSISGTADVSASGGGDASLPGWVQFETGSARATITVSPFDDALTEGDETVTLTLREDVT
ncbi:MAG TPA: Calx-beta domain-containing protein [Isosphaeraceae bacterium]